jgi:hypothetical protein
MFWTKPSHHCDDPIATINTAAQMNVLALLCDPPSRPQHPKIISSAPIP